ncbi:MAG: hypothetical protein KatS3mg105_4690 [Gemmatales bacterium]|nr:MAG: hypothetical protein KatS3mg105_4690 [Gemmatales bacterium]
MAGGLLNAAATQLAPIANSVGGFLDRNAGTLIAATANIVAGPIGGVLTRNLWGADLKTVGQLSLSSSDKLASLLIDDWRVIQRGLGLLRMVGGGVEMFLGADLAALGVLGAPETYGISLLGTLLGGAVFLHGADEVYAGFNEVWTGQAQQSYTEKWIQRKLVDRGMPASEAKEWANWINVGISVVGSFGVGSIRAVLAKAAPQSRAHDARLLWGVAWWRCQSVRKVAAGGAGWCSKGNSRWQRL